MKALFLYVFLFFSFAHLPAYASKHPHYDLEMTSREYRQELTKTPKSVLLRVFQQAGEIQKTVDLGKRNLDWLAFINQSRPADQQIAFTSPGTTVGIPIETPKEYGPSTIAKDYNDLVKILPQSLKDILLNNGSFTKDPPMSDADYILWGRKIDRAYQTATRWVLVSPYKQGYIQERKNDVRGYYFTQKDPDRENKLKGWKNLSAQDQSLWSEWLVGMCINQAMQNQSSCQSSLNSSINQTGNAWGFYDKYVSNSQRVWDSFFEVQVKRSDVNWIYLHLSTATIPFQDPSDAKVEAFLRDNIEDEWQWAGWQLKLDFKSAAFGLGMPHIVFQPDVVPHVDRLGGNEITMNARQSLDEYEVKWTIRHEFGHVLGYPDCYVEFYDDSRDLMINYQLDVDNLMCSRKGKFQQIHFDEFRKAYYQASP